MFLQIIVLICNNSCVTNYENKIFCFNRSCQTICFKIPYRAHVIFRDMTFALLSQNHKKDIGYSNLMSWKFS